MPPSSALLADLVAGPAPELRELPQAQNYRRAVVRLFAPHLRGNVLEIGAGAGHLTAVLRDLKTVARVVAVEPDARYHEDLLKRFPTRDLVLGGVAQVDGSEPWNAIVSFNTLQRLDNDTSELASYRRLLEGTKGRLCVWVPARPEIYSPADDLLHHRRRYTSRQLRRRLRDAGFQVVDMRYVHLTGYLAWWLRHRMLRLRHVGGFGAYVYDRTVLPPSLWVEEKVLRAPIGLSLCAIARVAH